MVTATSEDALIGSRFAIEIDSVQLAYFQSASGFSNETEVIEDKVASDSGLFTRKSPGQTVFGPLTLTRGVTSDLALWEWRKQVIDGDISSARRNMSLIMYNHAQEEVLRYDFSASWPSKWTGPAVKSDDASVVVEEMEIQYEFMERVS